MGKMNKYNLKLLAVPAVIATIYLALSLCCTIISIIDTGEYDVCLFDPFRIGTDGIFAYISMSELLPFVWDLYVLLPEAEIDLFSSFLDEKILLVIFTAVAVVLIIAGMFSKPAKNCCVDGVDREFLFTTRPHSVLKAILLPLDIIPAMWGFKYVPVIIPILFLPFILPFAVVAMVIVLIVFLIEKAAVGTRIKSAASKEEEDYKRDTGYAVCPKCKQKFDRPMVKCRCGLVFDYPIPGPYGIKEQYCVKGHVLPCTNENGARSKLTMVCPKCGQEFKTHEARPIVVCMVGAEGSGKSTLMVSAAEDICNKAKAKALYSETTSGISPDIQRIKDVLPPTVDGEIDSECLFVWSRDFRDREIIFNDISGHEFEPIEDRMIFQEYYRYVTGFVFTIDPLAVMALYNSNSTIKSNKTTVSGTLDSFYQVFTLVRQIGPSVRSDIPMAVVLTKMDNPRVQAAVKAEGSPEAFLNKYGEADFVKIMASEFSNIRYFAIGSLGNNSNAIEPVRWIISSADAELSRML